MPLTINTMPVVPEPSQGGAYVRDLDTGLLTREGGTEQGTALLERAAGESAAAHQSATPE